MTKGKRVLEAGEEEEEVDLVRHPKRRRVPVLARVVVEALQNCNLLSAYLEPIVRRVVSEEVERVLANVASSNDGPRHLPRQIEGPNGRNLQLRFRTALPPSMFTGEKIVGAEGDDVHIILVDANTGSPVSSGPEASARLDVLVLSGDFNREDTEDWTEDELEKDVVKGRIGKRPLLVGDLQVSLNKGVGTLGELSFTDNSRSTRSGKFRVAVKVAVGCCNGTRIREAVTGVFVVKENRGRSYEKHRPPALEDEVWRLEGIAKNGIFHRKLSERGVHTVGDILKFHFDDRRELREILGSNMSEKNWKKLVDHAKTASSSGKHNVYSSDETKTVGAIFNDQRVSSGLIEGNRFISKDRLNDGHQQLASTSVEKAYRNLPHGVTVYEGADLIRSSSSSDLQSCPVYLPDLDPFSEYPVTGNAIEGDFFSPGRDVNPAAMPSDPPADSDTHLLNPVAVPDNETEFAPPIENADDAGYGTEQQQHPHQSAGWDDLLSDEIRSILEEDEMQTVLNEIGRNEGSSDAELDYLWLSEILISDNERDPTPPRRAAVGWVKITTITTAMRWALFIRRRAAVRRSAELVELQD